MAIETRGIQRALNRFGVRVPRLVIASDVTAPVDTPGYLQPTAAPSGTKKAGDFYFNSTTNLWMTSDGTVFSGPMAKRPVKTSAATLTKADSGGLCVFNTAAGQLYTLPEAEAGLWFEFVVQTTATSLVHRIACASGDFLLGTILQGQPTTFTQTARTANGTTHLAWEGDGSTTGGIIGDIMRVVAISGTQWEIYGTNTATGSTATPFKTS